MLEGVLRALEAVADAAAALPRNVVRKPQVSRSLLVTVSLFWGGSCAIVCFPQNPVRSPKVCRSLWLRSN